jgi:phage protein D
MMDLEEKSVEHPAQAELVIANLLILAYAQYGLIPMVIPPPVLDPPIPIERVPVQQGTDLAYLNQMAARFGYVFYVVAGPGPLTSTAYWGPPVRVGPPQPALSVDMGAETNVTQLTFRNDALAPTQVVGTVQDRLTNQSVPVRSVGSLRPPLAAMPDWLVNAANVRTTRFRESGVNTMQALARAQGRADASSDSLTATGALDALRYGSLLTARGLVGLRGAGWQHDGLYYVKRVTHQITREEYTQSFTLTREGVGATTPVVRP